MNVNRDRTQEEIDSEIPFDPVGPTPTQSPNDPVTPAPAEMGDSEKPQGEMNGLIGDAVTAPTTIVQPF